MKNILKKLFCPLRRLNDRVQRIILRLLGGPGFSNPYFNVGRLWKHLIVQKVFRINSHVPWPVHWTASVKAPELIVRGTACPGCGCGAVLDGRNGIILGENLWMASHVKIISKNHDVNCYSRYVNDNPIVIGDDCWLGMNAVILPGVNLGNHTVVAAGAVVTKSFPQGNVVVAGVPAMIVKELKPYDRDAKGRRVYVPGLVEFDQKAYDRIMKLSHDTKKGQ